MKPAKEFIIPKLSCFNSLKYGYSKEELEFLIEKENSKDESNNSWVDYDNQLNKLLLSMGYDSSHLSYQEVSIFAYDKNEIYGIGLYYENIEIDNYPILYISTGTTVMGLGAILFKYTIKITEKIYKNHYIVVHSINDESTKLLTSLGYKPMKKEVCEKIFRSRNMKSAFQSGELYLIQQPNG